MAPRPWRCRGRRPAGTAAPGVPRGPRHDAAARPAGTGRRGGQAPVVAGGGVRDHRDAHDPLARGAAAAQVGTGYLLADEAGTNAVHRAALADPCFTSTTLTRAYTGRWARGLTNRFILDHPDAPPGYPHLHHLTAPLRAAAVRAGDPQTAHLWAGRATRPPGRCPPARSPARWHPETRPSPSSSPSATPGSGLPDRRTLEGEALLVPGGRHGRLVVRAGGAGPAAGWLPRLSSVRVVKQIERGVVFRLGRAQPELRRPG